ncbi:MAG: HTH domain-containing protein [Daejeonella sp.]|uniref:HTH domain-containing protein n=1 Tax=Daejeonella sp. JGW-45 TaxID=3034148 RepID=UPI0023ED953C|nr:HTH domain-containing protein [Daejeonella sp. JGW-45]
MKLLEQIERINRLHQLIKYKRTGTPEQLAKRLNLSTSMIYKIMEELRLNDAPIEYSRQLKTYYYSSQYLMHIRMDFRLLDDDEPGNRTE